MNDIEEIKDPDYEALTDKEKRFCEDYLLHRDKSRAALSTGCPEPNARQIGWAMYNRERVRSYIAKKFREMTSSVDEVIKRVDTMANTNMGEYFVDREEFHIPRIRVPLIDVIHSYEEKLRQEQLYAFEADLDDKELLSHDKLVKSIKNSIARMRIEHASNPLAYRIQDGEPEIITTKVLDLNKVIAAKDKVIIKKVIIKKDGSTEIETYNALDAAEKLIKIGGKYELDNLQKKPEGPDLTGLSDSALKELINAAKR